MYKTVLSLLLMFAISIDSVAMSKEQQAETLTKQLEKKAGEATNRLPPELLEVMQQAVETVKASGIEESARQIGDAAIDAELTGWNGETLRLSDLWADGPIVLMWYRGGWCPYCNLQLRAMQEKLKAMEDVGAKLVVLTPELPEKAKETAEANDVDFIALHDKENAIARRYGIVFDLPERIVPLYRDRLKLAEYNGTDAMELPLAATYVIDQGGTIRYAFLDADYKKRAEPADIIAAVHQLASPPSVGAVAPDLELQTPSGNTVTLASALEEGPAVVVVLRGFPGYQCPLCTRQVGSLIAAADELTALDATVILIYPGPADGLQDKAREFLQNSQLPDNFKFVIDPGYQFTENYSLRWDAPRETAYPSTFVVGQDGIIDFAKISKTHGDRAETSAVLEALQEDANRN